MSPIRMTSRGSREIIIDCSSSTSAFAGSFSMVSSCFQFPACVNNVWFLSHHFLRSAGTPGLAVFIAAMPGSFTPSACRSARWLTILDIDEVLVFLIFSPFRGPFGIVLLVVLSRLNLATSDSTSYTSPPARLFFCTTLSIGKPRIVPPPAATRRGEGVSPLIGSW